MNWASARRILCVRLDTIGDVLITGSAMRALGRDRSVTLLTSPSGAETAALPPEVDGVAPDAIVGAARELLGLDSTPSVHPLEEAPHP